MRGTAEAEDPGGGLAKPKMDRKRASVKGFLVTLLTALAVYLVAAAVSRAIIWDGVLPSETVLGDASSSSSVDGTAPSMLAGLVNPNNGSRPSLTATSDCTAGLPCFLFRMDRPSLVFYSSTQISFLCRFGVHIL